MHPWRAVWGEGMSGRRERGKARGGGDIAFRKWFVAYSPGFVSLQADASRALRQVDVGGTHTNGDASVDPRSRPITKKLAVERYCERFNDLRRGLGVTDE